MPEKVIFASLEDTFALLPKERRYALVTDALVEKWHAKRFYAQLQERGFAVELFSLPMGEACKTRRVKEGLEDALLARGFGRDTTLLALGGGALLDLAGFVAATYRRGIPLVSLPTTLLAMVDASIGGKRGVNTEEGKNLIGAFYPSSLIVIDLTLLDTLEPKEWKNGYAEMIKYGVIASKELFAHLERKDSLCWAMKQCIAIKQQIVLQDFEEKGLRRMLNFGHTVAHAVEKLLSYQIAHGEAVALGLACESYLSARNGLLSSAVHTRICALLDSYGFSLRLPPSVSLKALLKAMAQDKKAQGARVRFVLLDELGSAASFQGEYCTPVPPHLIEEMYAHFTD